MYPYYVNRITFWYNFLVSLYVYIIIQSINTINYIGIVCVIAYYNITVFNSLRFQENIFLDYLISFFFYINIFIWLLRTTHCYYVVLRRIYMHSYRVFITLSLSHNVISFGLPISSGAYDARMCVFNSEWSQLQCCSSVYFMRI